MKTGIWTYPGFCRFLHGLARSGLQILRLRKGYWLHVNAVTLWSSTSSTQTVPSVEADQGSFKANLRFRRSWPSNTRLQQIAGVASSGNNFSSTAVRSRSFLLEPKYLRTTDADPLCLAKFHLHEHKRRLNPPQRHILLNLNPEKIISTRAC